MKRSILLITVTFLSQYLLAQDFDSTAWKYSETINDKDVKKHLSILASDEYQGRETGKIGQKMAMKYLIEQFKSFGIKDYNNLNYVQKFNLIEQTGEGIDFILGTDTFKLNEDFMFSPNIIENTNKKYDLVFADYGIADENYNSFEGLNIENKIVFIWKGTPDVNLKEEWSPKDKVDWLKENGAAGVCYYDSKTEGFLSKYEHYFKKPKMQLSSDEATDFLTFTINEEMAKRIFSEGNLKFKKVEKKGVKKKNQFETSVTVNINKPTQNLISENVIAFIPGSEKPEEVIVLTAHYDHIGVEDSLVFNGADDDGTGTTALIEIAEAFTQAVKDGNGPKRSILIMPVSGEEKGLLGSRFYTENPIFPLENTVANLNIDMIGRYDKDHKKDSNYVYLIGSDKLSSELHSLSEQVNKEYMKINLDYTFNSEDDPNRFYYRSDHYNFAKNGIPVIFYFSGVHEDYHKATDTVEKIDFSKTARISRLVFLTAWHLANAEERITVDKTVEKIK